MSLLGLTADLRITLARDFSSGNWTPITQAWMQNLFTRVGGANAPTNHEIDTEIIPALAAIVTALGLTLTALGLTVTALREAFEYVEQAPAWEPVFQLLHAMSVPALEREAMLGDLSPHAEMAMVSLDIAPRVDEVPVWEGAEGNLL